MSVKNLRIAFIRQKYNPFGGAERFVERALQALEAYHVDMTVLSRKWNDASPGYRFVSCNPFYLGRLWRDWSFARSACRALEKIPVDLVQSHERIPCIDIYRAGDGVHKVWLSQKAMAGGKWSALFNRLSPYHRYVLAAEKRMFESPGLKAVICNSAMVRDEIIEHFSIDPGKIHVIYSGVDIDHFHPRLRDEYRDDMRQRYGLKQDDYVLLSVGSGFFRKGLSAIIDALKKNKKAPYLVVVGADRHLHKYKKQASAAGLQDRVILVGPQEDVRPYYGMADVFILPSLYDPFPNAVLEAMACALPVITSNKTGAAEFIDEGIQGYVVDAFHEEGLVAAIEKLSDSTQAVHMGEQARRKLESFGLDTMADKLVAFYAEVVKH